MGTFATFSKLRILWKPNVNLAIQYVSCPSLFIFQSNGYCVRASPTTSPTITASTDPNDLTAPTDPPDPMDTTDPTGTDVSVGVPNPGGNGTVATMKSPTTMTITMATTTNRPVSENELGECMS